MHQIQHKNGVVYVTLRLDDPLPISSTTGIYTLKRVDLTDVLLDVFKTVLSQKKWKKSELLYQLSIMLAADITSIEKVPMEQQETVLEYLHTLLEKRFENQIKI